MQVSLTVDHPQKVLLMGEAQDYGTCKGVKKNGEPCSQIVNLVGPFCPATSAYILALAKSAFLHLNYYPVLENVCC